MNFTPHSAAATTKDNDIVRKSTVWNGFQLNGDVRERMGLKRKWSTKDWVALLAKTHPNAQDKNAKGRKLMYWCLGDVCPDTYQMPQDWNVLGNLLHNKISRTNPDPRLLRDQIQVSLRPARIRRLQVHQVRRDQR